MSNSSPPAFEDNSRKLARHLIDKYFRTNEYPYTRHHIQSYDQFVKKDLSSIVKSNNPILLLKDLIKDSNNQYKYRVEIYVGGKDGSEITVGTPTVSLQNTEEVRILYPNEARLRNLTYSTIIYANIYVRITYTYIENKLLQAKVYENTFEKYELCNLPVMLHSSLCGLHGKPREFLEQAGECPYDHGGYFIVDGSEKILITRQEQAFNTLYTSMPANDEVVHIYATIQCLSPQTRQVKRVSFALMRDKCRFNSDAERNKIKPKGELMVSIPFVRKPIPLFVLFRALGVETDEDIFNIIFPEVNGAERQLLGHLLLPSAVNAIPFFTKNTAIQYIKTLTKGFSEEHVLDILYNQFFIHIDNQPNARAMFLGDCVRSILRVAATIDKPTDKDDTRNQRCLTSGFLTQMLFAGVYKQWMQAINKRVGEEYKYNQATYENEKFKDIFAQANRDKVFLRSFITDGLMRGFKGKWGSSLGDEKSGVLQALTRQSYMDFMSHCRRVVSSFDTSLKLTGPRHLHPSQFGFFCTNETPGGSSIGIAKNLTILSYISTGTDPQPFVDWLRTRMMIRNCDQVTPDERVAMTPIYVNAGIVGFTKIPIRLTRLLKLFKHTGFLPPTTSITFNIRTKRVAVYMDEGRPVRPLIVLKTVAVGAGNGSSGGARSPNENVEITSANRNAIRSVDQQLRMPYKRLAGLPTWRDLLMGDHPDRLRASLDVSEFNDPLADIDHPTIENYEQVLAKHVAPIEYVDPYEQNEAYIANFAEQIMPETTHIEIHPSTILSVVNSQIPFANHNQSPRNQLGCAQAKQSLSIYATNWQNRFDNNAHILCYGEAPLTRTIYQDYFGEGRMPYGQNITLALCCYTGYNQEDGIVMNKDAIDRGLFRSIAYRTYEAREEDDDLTYIKTRIGNPSGIAAWMDLRPGLDYGKLDDQGIIKVGEFVDEMTVIVGAYMLSDRGDMKDASVTPQVWTRGRVEQVVVTVSNMGMRTVKIRVCQDRKPELGDKFCLTPDHEVLTATGWKSIAEVNHTDKVYSLTDSGVAQFVSPTGFYSFRCEDEDMYCVSSENVELCATMNHKMVVGGENPGLIEARELVGRPVYFKAEGAEHLVVPEKVTIRKYTGAVHCIEVPSHIFYVRLNGKPVWTGNSNRHGQKGTIGMLVRGHDMPRTESGLVPDLLVNPHSIPSRMTMGQLMEQIMGKVGVKIGSHVDGTPFMNEGTPSKQAGDMLEELGFERYGNEMLYNGHTGQQILCDIFIAPIYGMRLKHMVEDKWQARDKGRKEQRTHQPTGGRGAQGGLKIGEQERDAVICHGAAGFQRESFMTRSDGHVFPICTGCGTVPIVNEKLGIAICTLCDGPIQFSGTTVNNLEIIPPTTKPTAEIVNVEIPYATKLLEQELNAFLNMSMRFVTTKGVQKLATPILELKEGDTERRTELQPRKLEDVVIPGLVEQAPPPDIDEVKEAARKLGMNLVPVAPGVEAADGGPEGGVPAIAAATDDEVAVEGIIEQNPVGAEGTLDAAAGIPTGEVDTGAAIDMAAARVAGTNEISIDTSRPAMEAEGIDTTALTGELPPPPGETGPASAPRRTLGGGGRRVGFGGQSAQSAQSAEDRTGSSISSSAIITVRKLE